MEDYRLSQTGQEVQNILNGAAMQVDLNTEVERATDAEGTLQENIDAEAQARQDADGLLQQGIDDEAQRAKDAEEANAGEIEGIKALIPATATSDNKLADTNFVNSSIQTATAEYRGDYNVVTDLHLAIDATHAQIETLLPTVIAEADKNDYCYVMIPTNASTPTEIAKIERYKMTSEEWKFEYDVNNSTFTAEEWAAIKSGITSGLVAKLNALPTKADLLLLLAGKQDVLTFDSVPVPESNNPVKSGGVYSAIDDEKTARLNSDTAIHAELDGLQAKVPATASSDNKLVDQNQMNSSISTATATFRGDWNVVSDLHLSVDATSAQIAALLPTVISTADNNDYCYVEIPTSAETPTQIERVERYKFNGTAWAFEYVLNNSGFTAAQWAAINSMITSGLVAKLSALPTNADLLAMLAQKQDNLTFDSTPTENSTNPVTSGGVFAADKALSDAIEAILLLIPSAASSLNKLVDTALMNSSISTATATFRGTYNLVSGLNLDIDATEGQIAAALLSAISTADNNDYSFVQIPTSAQTPTQIARTDRYKFNGTAWAFEYTLNTSGFTATQWAAINSGVTDTLVAELANIANLIPSEASQYNKLADKVYVITQIIAHIADFKGEYGTLLELQSVLNPKPGDLGIVRTKDNNGKDVYTFYQYKDSLWNEYYTLSYHPQIKPATTGTTGDYPYNGMGRVELPMNMVNGVNTLTQDMFYKGAVGFREPNTNTIFVIRYDFDLNDPNGEHPITIPENCVLEFNGGKLFNGTLIGNQTEIAGEKKDIFDTTTVLQGHWSISKLDVKWFGAHGGSDESTAQDDAPVINHVIRQSQTISSWGQSVPVYLECAKYYIDSPIDVIYGTVLIGDNIRVSIDIPSVFIIRRGTVSESTDNNCAIRLYGEAIIRNINISILPSLRYQLDGILLKAGNVNIENVSIKGARYGINKMFTLGDGISGVLSDIRIENCRRGISISDYGTIDRSGSGILTWMTATLFKNISIKGVFEIGIYIDLISLLDNITIENCDVSIVGNRAEYCDLNYTDYVNAIYLSCYKRLGMVDIKDCYIENVYYTPCADGHPVDGKYLVDGYDYRKNAVITLNNISLNINSVCFQNCLDYIASLGGDVINMCNCYDGGRYVGTNDTQQFYVVSVNNSTKSVNCQSCTFNERDLLNRGMSNPNLCKITTKDIKIGNIAQQDVYYQVRTKSRFDLNLYISSNGIYYGFYNDRPISWARIGTSFWSTGIIHIILTEDIAVSSQLNLSPQEALDRYHGLIIDLNGHTLTTSIDVPILMSNMDFVKIANGVISVNEPSATTLMSVRKNDLLRRTRIIVSDITVRCASGSSSRTYYIINNGNWDNAKDRNTDVSIINVKSDVFTNLNVGPGSDGYRFVDFIGNSDVIVNNANIGPMIRNASEWRKYVIQNYGTTADRPVLSRSYDNGTPYFDTTLNKPVWWTGTAWVDATGNQV